MTEEDERAISDFESEGNPIPTEDILMKFIAHLKVSSELDIMWRSKERESGKIGKNTFTLQDDTYVCYDIIDLVSLEDKEDVIIEVFGIDPLRLVLDQNVIN